MNKAVLGSTLPERVSAIVLAAGRGRRMNGTDKIFACVGGRPLITYSLDAIKQCSVITEVVLVLPHGRVLEGKTLVNQYEMSDGIQVCAGGDQRQDSVWEGLKRLSSPSWVVIHDGARPCVRKELIIDGLEAVRETGAAIPVIPVIDTIKYVSSRGIVESTAKRDDLWAVQTPQFFGYNYLLAAHEKCTAVVTDDATMLESLGYPVKVFPGSPSNIKVTTEADLLLVEAILCKERGYS